MNAWPMVASILVAAALLVLAVALGAMWLALRRAGMRLEAMHGLVTRLLEAQAPVDARLEALAALVREERAFAPLARAGSPPPRRNSPCASTACGHAPAQPERQRR